MSTICSSHSDAIVPRNGEGYGATPLNKTLNQAKWGYCDVVDGARQSIGRSDSFDVSSEINLNMIQSAWRYQPCRNPCRTIFA